MTIGRSYCIVIQVLRKHDAAVAQSVERRIGSAEVTGPIPVSSFLKPLKDQGFLFLQEKGAYNGTLLDPSWRNRL